ITRSTQTSAPRCWHSTERPFFIVKVSRIWSRRNMPGTTQECLQIEQRERSFLYPEYRMDCSNRIAISSDRRWTECRKSTFVPVKLIHSVNGKESKLITFEAAGAGLSGRHRACLIDGQSTAS